MPGATKDRIWTLSSEHVPDNNPGDAVTFGRHATCSVQLGQDPIDTAVSRHAGEFRCQQGSWIVANTGSRTIFVVEAGRELELRPPVRGRSEALLHGGYGWIRLPGSPVDHAVEFQLGGAHRSEAGDRRRGSTDLTDLELVISITDNERRSVVAVYESYLQLPPKYRREPRSFRAAASRLRVEEGKVKADLRRVRVKVGAAGGPDLAGSRGRDGLFEWLCGHGVIGRNDRDLLGP